MRAWWKGLVVVLWLVGEPLAAQGHGPIYGLSTPTLGRGGWSLDVGAMTRLGKDGRHVMARPMLSYGLTEDVQLFASVPLSLVRRGTQPLGRAFLRMPATRDVEVGVGWRLQRHATGVGARRESTLWLALDQPVDRTRGGVETAPGVFGALVTGYASRAVYLWGGGAYRRHAGRAGDRLGDIGAASLVVGYRPPMFRGDYPSPDWRGFLEVVGEWTDENLVGGQKQMGTSTRRVFLGITALGLYGSWGITAGPAFPLFQDVDDARLEENSRVALNLTFWW